MEIDKARNIIADKLSSDETDIQWGELFEPTNPGHYLPEDLVVTANFSDIMVNMPQETFTFNNVSVSFTATLGGSRSSVQKNFTLTVSGEGEFKFIPGGRDLNITDFSITEPLILYGK